MNDSFGAARIKACLPPRTQKGYLCQDGTNRLLWLPNRAAGLQPDPEKKVNHADKCGSFGTQDIESRGQRTTPRR